MLCLEGDRGTRPGDGLSRRDFLRVGGLAVGLGLTGLARPEQLAAAPASTEQACIQLFLVGGPSHLDTWDLKPDAPAEVRGPFRPIRTNVPGLDLCEHFPQMARRADRFAVLRSLYHKESPIHETGHQLMQTGTLFRGDVEWPHFGAVLGKLRPAPASGLPPWVVLPGPIGNTGVGIGHGQTAGFLGPEYGPHFVSDGAAGRAFDLDAEREAVRDRYGRNTFGQNCLRARRLVQHGVRFVTVNMFDTVFHRITWDCHATGGDLCATLDDYRTTLCPMLDQAYTALLDDLEVLGLLGSTLVLAVGEFGRTPKVNNRNGRDHWPGVWSGLVAGGGVRGGQVVGASDRRGEEPRDRPVHPSEIAATVYHALGIDLGTRLPGPDGRPMPLVEARPVMELFC